MSRAWFKLAALLWVPAWGHAADLTPQDFAFGLPVITTQDAAVYRVALPLAVYQGSVRDDLGDLRVFNGHGEAVPYSLMRPAPPAHSREAATALPLFPLHGSARIVLDGVRLSVESPGAAVDLQTHSGVVNNTVNQYILDARGLTTAIAALQLQWPETAADYSGRIKIEASDDLDAWQTVAAAAPTANLHAKGQALIENRIALPATRAKFWRISWVGPAPAFELSAVLAESADTPTDLVHAALDVSGARDSADVDSQTFDLGAHPPISRVNVELPEPNTVTTIELSSRHAPRDPWRTVVQASFYRLKAPEGEQHNAPVEIGVDHDRYWRARLVRGGASSTPLRLHVEWVPSELTFLARGQAPFLVVYGASAAAGAESDLSQVPTDVEIAAATLSAPRIVGGASRLAAERAPFSALRVLLWTALLLAAVLLGWMAFRLSKDANAAKSPRAH